MMSTSQLQAAPHFTPTPILHPWSLSKRPGPPSSHASINESCPPSPGGLIDSPETTVTHRPGLGTCSRPLIAEDQDWGHSVRHHYGPRSSRQRRHSRTAGHIQSAGTLPSPRHPETRLHKAHTFYTRTDRTRHACCALYPKKNDPPTMPPKARLH